MEREFKGYFVADGTDIIKSGLTKREAEELADELNHDKNTNQFVVEMDDEAGERYFENN